MYNNFHFQDGSNPYITVSNKGLFDMIRAFDLEQTGANTFEVLGRVTYYTTKGRKLTAREKGKAALAEFAKMWQNNFCNIRYSWDEVITWEVFFEEYGKKYGLLREFKENGIC